jgi:hypothetical protein
MKRHALFVGVDDYADPTIQNLRYPSEDAAEMASVFRRLLKFDRVEKLINPGHAPDVVDAVKALARGLGPGDLFLVFFAGHGFRVKDSHVLVCAKDEYAELANERVGLSVGWIKERMRGPWNQMLVLDACQNDIRATRGGDTGVTARDLELIHATAPVGGDSGWQIVVTSCSEGQRALEVSDLGHGLFTSAFLDSVTSLADARRRIDLETLRADLGDRMGRLIVRYHLSGEQVPLFTMPPSAADIVLLDGAAPVPDAFSPVRPVVPALVVCPVCGKKNEPKDTFRCRECGRDDLCLDHRDGTTFLCAECAKARKAKEEEERHAREVEESNHLKAVILEMKLEAERKAKEEATRKAKEEAERHAREEEETKLKAVILKMTLEAERKAKAEAARKTKEEAERKAKEEAARRAREESARKAKEEAERNAVELLKEIDEAEFHAQEEAERRAAERKARSVRFWLIVPAVLVIGAAGSLWALRPKARPQANGREPPLPVSEGSSDFRALLSRYGVASIETNGATLFRGDFPTRAERLAASAAIYEEKPGALCDFADRETLLASASDLLLAATDGALRIADVTNRVAVLAGRAPDPAFLNAAIEALLDAVPRLSGTDASSVVLDSPLAPASSSGLALPTRRLQKPRLPLVGILMEPYPCLLLQNGQRLAVGAEIGGYTIERIAQDRITLRRGEEDPIEWTP